jgi:hypothetical protein
VLVRLHSILGVEGIQWIFLLVFNIWHASIDITVLFLLVMNILFLQPLNFIKGSDMHLHSIQVHVVQRITELRGIINQLVILMKKRAITLTYP